MATETFTIRKTYKYRLYQHTRRNRALCEQIEVAGRIWNHCVALHKRYYRLTCKHLSSNKLQAHIAALRKHAKRYSIWKRLGSQAVQDVVQRLERAYQRFFDKDGGLPRFKKIKTYTSFTLKQRAGWKLLPDLREPVAKPDGKGFKRGVGQLEVSGQRYKYVKHRPILGTIKTVTIKRDAVGQLWVCFSVIEAVKLSERAMTGQSAGADFGLKTFLTTSDGQRWMHPLFFTPQLHCIRQLNRSLSRKQPGSHNRHRAKWLLARAHQRIADKRRDFHYQLAHHLCDEYDHIYLEDLTLAGMKQLWGRKVSDLGFHHFVKRLENVAFLRRVFIGKIDRFEATTKRCSQCGHHQPMPLSVRTFTCEACGLVLDRDVNAAINILHLGASRYGPDTSQS